MNVVAATKKYIGDDRYRLRLFDAVVQEVRGVTGRLHEERFSVTGGWSDEEFRKRVPAFEEVVADLCGVEALIARWGGRAEIETLTLPLRRTCDRLDNGSGNSGWLELQWYPVLALLYAGGIAAVSAGRYDALRALLHAPVRVSGKDQPLVTAVTEGLSDRTRAFRLLQGLDRHHTPCSDRLFDALQPLLDELLFLGSDYERAFDRFEMVYGFEYAYQSDREWGPIGRFGWKGVRSDSSPLLNLLKEIEVANDTWPPVAAGLCGGSIEKVKVIAGAFTRNVRHSSTW
jgi:hypothetical protein